MNPIVEKIAKVIYLHGISDTTASMYPWEALDSSTTQEHYRRIARGTIDAMGLTEQVEMAWLAKEGLH